MAKAEKLIKKEIINEASKNPEKFYPVPTLEKFKLQRQACKNCQVKFWASTKRDVCGEPECVGGYTFIENTPAKVSLEFPEVYHTFAAMLKKEGYTSIKRFPTVARWRDDLDFNIASIIGFQPYVVKGLVEPPANPLTIPQICLRFADIDNVGYTGRHHTGFTMIGQHAFQPPKDYDQASYFTVWLNWYLEGMKIPLQEITIHEDAWAGGGNCGASLEVFAGGLELGNQVYMMYDMSEATTFSELKELDIKVLDMGMGQERCCWFSKGSLNSYDANMPRVCKYLFEKTQLKPNWTLYKKFLPLSGNLNLDEVEDIDKAWENVAKQIGEDVSTLKKEIEPLAGLYSIADHTRTLLYAFTDGALPSNVKGGYNLRLILRRALDFITKFNWDVDLYDVMVLQAEELDDIYPELKDELKGIKKILDIEYGKYNNHKEKVENKINQLLKKKDTLTPQEFVKFYISEGITPEEIKDAFAKQEKKIEIPTNFFTLVTEYFEQSKQSEAKTQKNELMDHVIGLPETKTLYYEDSYKEKGSAKILKEFEHKGKHYIILDKTLFYPTGGGQSNDVGEIDSKKVINVIKVGNIILHEVK